MDIIALATVTIEEMYPGNYEEDMQCANCQLNSCDTDECPINQMNRKGV